MLKPAGPWKDPYFHLSIHCIFIVFYFGGRGDWTAAKYLLERSGPSGHFQRNEQSVGDIHNWRSYIGVELMCFAVCKLFRSAVLGYIELSIYSIFVWQMAWIQVWAAVRLQIKSAIY